MPTQSTPTPADATESPPSITRIISLTAENVKRIKAIEIHPTSASVIIGGRNGQGKTSLLDCITMALGGASAAPPEPIRRGAAKGQIVLATEELIVTRKFSKSGSTSLEVTNRDGLRFPGPQAVLDKLTTSLSFDPLEFVRAKPRDQFERLQKMLGVDTAPIDAEKKAVFERRTAKNRDVKALAAVVESLPISGPEPVVMAEIVDELSRAEEINRGVADLEREVMEADDQFKRAKANLIMARNIAADLSARLVAAEENIIIATGEANQAEAATVAATERAARAERLNTEPIKQRIREAESVNQAAAKVTERKTKADELAAMESEASMMTEHLKELDTKRAAMLSSVEMPVPGLGFSSDGITLNDIPLEQASAAEQLKLGLAVACAMNPRLRVMLIRDGSLLDADSMALVEETAVAHNAQVWIERVGNDGGCTVVIEDGEALPESAVKAGAGSSKPVTAEAVKADPPAPEPEKQPEPVAVTADPGKPSDAYEY